MERAEARMSDEWKANNELLKFYEDLKQKRFAHFLTIQTAFLAIFGLLTREAMGAFSLVSLAAMAVATIPPLFIAFHFIRVDARGRAFVDTANTRLLLLEAEWKARFPDNHCATYQQQFAVLSRRDHDTVDQYLVHSQSRERSVPETGPGPVRACERSGNPATLLVALDHRGQRYAHSSAVAPGPSALAAGLRMRWHRYCVAGLHDGNAWLSLALARRR